MASITNSILIPKTNAAKTHLRTAATAAVTNSALCIAVVVLGLGNIGQAAWNIHLSKEIRDGKPLVVRVDKVGRAEAVNMQWDEYRPEDSDMKYFLTQFVTGFYARNHATVEDIYPVVLHYLREDLFQTVNAEDRRTKWMAQFVTSTDPDVNVHVLNVALDRHMDPNFKAVIDATKTAVSKGGIEAKTTHFVVTVWFHLQPELVKKDPRLIMYNPLGFKIDSFRADDAFVVDQ